MDFLSVLEIIVVVICAIAVLAVIFLMYRFLLKDKLIMELMAEKEVS